MMRKFVIVFVHAGLSIFFTAVKPSQEGIFGRFILGFSPGSRSCPKKEIYGGPHFSEVYAFSQIKEALGRLLSACVES